MVRLYPIIITQIVTLVVFVSCSSNKQDQITNEINSIDLVRGDIALCGTGRDQFGDVSFTSACSDKVRDDFNLATALLHSFEYTEAEKVFARVIDADPQCLMAYWGVAMSNFHPLWAPPTSKELEKGSQIISLARSIRQDSTTRESAYLEAIATIYDEWDKVDHRTRLQQFEKACAEIYQQYPGDHEAAMFYALALGAAADPADKTFSKQKKAGAILNDLFAKKSNHPGIAHYIIHTFDYPELAEMALPAARKYASIAAASAHAQHMPSHIFTRLGLWNESIQSNLKSVSAAQCYAENSGMDGHWDEELHGMDYLMYAYLQQGNDTEAEEQLNYLKGITRVTPVNFKVAYCYAAMPARYMLERKDWEGAAKLEFHPVDFSWEKYPWEKSNIIFARILGAVHTNRLTDARRDVKELDAAYSTLKSNNDEYKANLVLIQIKAANAWIKFAEGKTVEAVVLMAEAADMEDRTSKHPVTPGEIIPARELLADMFFAVGDYKKALNEYEADLKTHPKRLNALYGAALASKKIGKAEQAMNYYRELVSLADSADTTRPELLAARAVLKGS